jgi:hypothetical protein
VEVDSGAARHHRVGGYAESGAERQPNPDARTPTDEHANRCTDSGTNGDERSLLIPVRRVRSPGHGSLPVLAVVGIIVTSALDLRNLRRRRGESRPPSA